MRRIIIAVLMLGPFVVAQAPTRLESGAQVAAEIARARATVFIASPTMASLEVADALRLAVLRGVRVRLLVDPRYTEDPDSYAPGLDALQWAYGGQPDDAERVAPYDPQRFIIRTALDPPHLVLIDDEVVLQGPYIERDNLPFDAGKTYVLRDASVYARRVDDFAARWRVGLDFFSLTTRHFSFREE